MKFSIYLTKFYVKSERLLIHRLSFCKAEVLLNYLKISVRYIFAKWRPICFRFFSKSHFFRKTLSQHAVQRQWLFQKLCLKQIGDVWILKLIFLRKMFILLVIAREWFVCMNVACIFFHLKSGNKEGSNI